MPPSVSNAAATTPVEAPPEPRRLRRRLAGLVAVVVMVAAVAVAIAVTSGESDPPPANGAAALVPADALLYIHLSTDPGRPAVRRALALLGRLPDHGSALAAIARRILDVVGGATGTDFAHGIRPWLGHEAAFALLDTSGGSAGSLTILDVSNRAAAVRFLSQQGAQRAPSISGATVYDYPTGAELAFIGHYLVVGADADLRAATQVWHGQVASLAANATYRRASADAAVSRVLDAYAPAAGVLRVLQSRSGFLGALGALISPPALLGAELTVSPRSPGLVVHLHLVLDPATAARDSKRLQNFRPSLPGVLPPGSTLMLDARNLSSLAPILLGATSEIGLLSQIPDLLHRLGDALGASGVNVQAFLHLFKGETAVALARGSGAPALVIVTRTDNEQAAAQILAGIEPVLAHLFGPGGSGGGFEPEMSDVTVAGVAAHRIALGPGLQVDFAVFRGLIVIATSQRGIFDLAGRVGSLDHDSAFGAVLGKRTAQVTSLGFADFNQLLSLGEQTQLAQSAGYRNLVPELQQIRAVGIDSTRGEDDTSAELLLNIP